MFIARYNEIRDDKLKDSDQTGGDATLEQPLLLGTIKMPKNLRLLTERLPKSNYGQKIEKQKLTLQTENKEKIGQKSPNTSILAPIVEEDHGKQIQVLDQSAPLQPKDL